MPSHMHAEMTGKIQKEMSHIVGGWFARTCRSLYVLWSPSYWDLQLRREVPAAFPGVSIFGVCKISFGGEKRLERQSSLRI